MAWNNNSGGPWGGGGGGNSGGPWGGGGGGNRGGGGGPFGSRRPPDMEDVIRKGQERLKNLIPGGFGSYKGIVLVVLLGLVIWLVTKLGRIINLAVQAFGRAIAGDAASVIATRVVDFLTTGLFDLLDLIAKGLLNLDLGKRLDQLLGAVDRQHVRRLLPRRAAEELRRGHAVRQGPLQPLLPAKYRMSRWNTTLLV